MPTLYRKYRPQIFSSLSGQEHITRTIENAIALGKVAHAYLFSGPRGVGKTTTARLLAKAVNCPNRLPNTFEPCDKCTSCEEIAGGRNIDVIEIDAASHTGVDNVRENIIDNAQFKPTKSPFKIFIIDEVHMLSNNAFNALLKTIEEPPAHVIFIMATTEMHKLPATIVSRCQRFVFSKISGADMLARLKTIAIAEDVEVDTDVLKKIVHKSDGCLRDAESLFGQILSLGLKKITVADTESVLPSPRPDKIITLLENTFSHDASAGFSLLSSLTKDGINLENFFYDLIDTLRLLLIIQTGFVPEELADYDEENTKRIKKLAAQISPKALIKLIDIALIRRQEIKRAPTPELPIEMWIVEASFGNEVALTQMPAPTPEKMTKKETPPSTPPHVPPTTPTEPPASSTPPTEMNTLPQTVSIESQPTVNKITDAIKSVILNITHSDKPQLTLEQVKEKWPEMIKQLSVTNHSLTFILTMSKLTAIEEQNLIITFPYTFHKEKVEDPKIKSVLESVLEQLLGQKLKIICRLNEDTAIKPETDIQITDLAATFGGEVIE